MNYEPLNNLLSLYDISKHDEILKKYLNEETVHLIENYYYITDINELFLYDKLILINKSTGKLYKQGYIMKTENNNIIIKTNLMNIKINSNNYYLFKKNKKSISNKTKRKYYEELLNSLS
jgi:hypothetical protein